MSPVKVPFTSRIASAILASPIGKAIQAALAVSAETDLTFFPQGLSNTYRDRIDYDRATILSECLRAWRVNPIARRVVILTTAFIIGEGLQPKSKNKATDKFLKEWWNHELNDLDTQIPEWSDEKERTGDLFLLCSVNNMNGMMYVRAIPSEQIKDIQTAENDARQEKYYLRGEIDESPYPAYDPTQEQDHFVLHYSTNRPVGAKFGEPNLAPLIPWIGRFATWLEDRARLNHFRSAFMYIVRGKYKNEEERKKREAHINMNPPRPGTVLVSNDDDAAEKWGILSATLDSFDASVDGLAMKKMIAIGAGFPLHYLAEPESSTRTTAEASGSPTFRSLEQEQKRFVQFIQRLARLAVSLRKAHNKNLVPDTVIIEAPDITERDNAQLAMAFARAYPSLAELFDRGLIDETELMKRCYLLMGQVYDGTAPKGLKKPLEAKPVTPPDDPEAKKDDEPEEENLNQSKPKKKAVNLENDCGCGNDKALP